MLTKITRSCPSEITDAYAIEAAKKYVDKNGMIDFSIGEDPKVYPEGIIRRFLKNLECNVDKHLNIIQHFHGVNY